MVDSNHQPLFLTCCLQAFVCIYFLNTLNQNIYCWEHMQSYRKEKAEEWLADLFSRKPKQTHWKHLILNWKHSHTRKPTSSVQFQIQNWKNKLTIKEFTKVRTRNLFQSIHYMIHLVNWPEIKRYWQIQHIRIFRSASKTAEHSEVCSCNYVQEIKCGKIQLYYQAINRRY